MNILICGASGFVGRHLRVALEQAGHRVTGAVRRPCFTGDITVDFVRDITPEVWLSRLEGIDVVINAVGVLRNTSLNPMMPLHRDTPLALFNACRQAEVKRVVHISALGTDSGVNALYFSSRRAAEMELKALPETMRSLCLRPSVIYGKDGSSALMFRRLANLPVHLLPMGGAQTMQPVHIDDICLAIKNWLEDEQAVSCRVDAVGAEQTTMRGMLDSYRKQDNRGKAFHVTVPKLLMQFSARIGDQIPFSPLCSDTLAMMNAGNTGDYAEFEALLGRVPMSYQAFIGCR